MNKKHFLLLFTLICLGAGNAWGTTKSYSYTWNASDSYTDNKDHKPIPETTWIDPQGVSFTITPNNESCLNFEKKDGGVFTIVKNTIVTIAYSAPAGVTVIVTGMRITGSNTVGSDYGAQIWSNVTGSIDDNTTYFNSTSYATSDIDSKYFGSTFQTLSIRSKNRGTWGHWVNIKDITIYYTATLPNVYFKAVAMGPSEANAKASFTNESFSSSRVTITKGGDPLNAPTTDITAYFSTAQSYTIDDITYSFEGWYKVNADGSLGVLYSDQTTCDSTFSSSSTNALLPDSIRLYAQYTQKNVPVFTFNLNVGVVGQPKYENVFWTSNDELALTSVTNSNDEVATIEYNLSARTINVTALTKGQTKVTITQSGNEDWVTKTQSYIITIVNQGEWIWQQDEVTSGNNYYIYSSTSGFLNDADGFDSSPTLLWTVGGTALSKYSLTASSGKTLSIYDNDWKWNVTTSGTYSGGDINLKSGLSNGYYSIWREGGVHATFGYGAYYVASNNSALEMWSSASYEWLFVSSAQKAAYDSYIAASEYVGNYTSRYPSLENELSAVIGSNNYESADWATCKANLDAIIAKCDAFDADYAKFNEEGNKHTISTTADGFATIYYACPIELPDGVTAYKGAYSNGVLTLTDIDRDGYVPACTPVLLHNDDGSNTSIVLTYYNGNVSSVTGNKLHGTSDAITLSGTTVDIDDVSGTPYGLGQKNNHAGFYRYANNGTISANKAFLVIDNDESLAAIRIIREETITTDAEMFDSANTAEVTKFFENGQLFIKRDGVIYDAIGRKIR